MANNGSSAGFLAKKAVVKTSLLALGVTFELASKGSDDLKRELADWEEGRIFSLGVLPDGPSIAVRKEGDHLVYLGSGDHGAKLKIMFKNIDSAFMTLSGMIGAHTAFAEHRAIVHGSISEAMEANRAMAIVTKFLFPGFWLKKITKRPPPMSGKDLLLKAKIMAVLTPMLALKAAK